MELIKIDKQQVDNDFIDTVNASDLHEFLEAKTKFSDWIKHRINTYGFEKNKDYIVLQEVQKNSSGGRPADIYHLSIDMAKELSMVERNKKGKEARVYFIEMEKKAKQTPVLSNAEMFLQNAKLMVEYEKRIAEINNRIDKIEAKQITHSEDFYTVSGYCSVHNLQVTKQEANALGRKCAKLSRERCYKIDKVHDAKYGSVNAYHSDILQEIIC